MERNIIFIVAVSLIVVLAYLLLKLLDYMQNGSKLEFALNVYAHNLCAMWGSIKDDESYQDPAFLRMHNTGNIPNAVYEIKYISFIDDEDCYYG